MKRVATKVYLVGMMGSGKTTVGTLLAKRLGWAFIDLDAEIERTTGKSVMAIFTGAGEEAFRTIESTAIEKVAAADAGAVIALGGGAVIEELNRKTIRATGDVFWLRAAPEALAARLGEAADRPLLAGLDRPGRVEKLAALLEQREPLYRGVAHGVLETQARDPGEIAREIADAVERVRVVRVDLVERRYDAIIEAGGLARLGERLDRLGLGERRFALVTDATVAGHHLERVRAALARGCAVVSTLEPGEGAKKLERVGALLEEWSRAGLERGSYVVALGGGVVTDVAGFAASIFLRGVPWVALPTTLLAMVDAAIGGKTGVNLPAGKNLAGAFHQPALVVCDPSVLGTLAPREVRSGLGEVLKYALIGPRDLFDFVERHIDSLAAPGGLGRHAARAAELIARCVDVKAGVVSRDERETGGERKTLNFGHTFGHAVESASGFTLAHGDCVVLGMRAALHLSVEAGLLPFDEARALARFLERTGVPPLPAPLESFLGDEDILAALARDKKFAGGKRLFVLLAGPGAPRVDVEVPEERLRSAIEVMRGRRDIG